MTYQKQAWVARETVVSAARMNHIEEGIAEAHTVTDETPRVQAGRVNITPSADAPTSADVVFPVPFSAPPEMTASALSGAPGTVQEVTVDAMTTTGARIWIRRTSAVTTSISWIAVGPR